LIIVAILFFVGGMFSTVLLQTAILKSYLNGDGVGLSPGMAIAASHNLPRPPEEPDFCIPLRVIGLLGDVLFICSFL